MSVLDFDEQANRIEPLVPQQPIDRRPVDRRRLLRGAGLVAGAAGATVLLTAAPPTARAADGDPVTVGRVNGAASTTTLRLGGRVGSDDPTLSQRRAGR